MISFPCAHCGRTASRTIGHVNRARAQGLNLYCSRKCSGLGRRDKRTKAEKKEAKRLYDLEYRANNLEYILERKREYHLRTYDPAKEAIKRKKKMPWHIEYCRQPEYRKWKAEYDKKHRASKYFGPFADAYLTLRQIETEIRERATDYEVRQEKGTLNKSQQRRREDGADKRRRRDSPADSE
jgi:alpha-ketoglutarate-dependent taurine dioxygenase